ncbi:MAG TPA: FAD synthetase family protein [Spirochaetia bacterium]
MRILSWADLVAGRERIAGPVRMTIGVFDGIHVGHRRLMEAITAGPRDAVPLVVTFGTNPVLRVSPRGQFPGMITTPAQKMAILESLGIAAVVVIDFSEEMRNLSGEAFVGLLRQNLTIQKIVVGQNFRFGKSRNSGTDDLKRVFSETGTQVHVMEPVLWGGHIVSSTRIRAAIAHADFGAARAMLANDFALDFRGLPSTPEGRELRRFPRASLSQVVPAPGVYEVRCTGGGPERPGKLEIQEDSLAVSASDCGDIAMVLFN